MNVKVLLRNGIYLTFRPLTPPSMNAAGSAKLLYHISLAATYPCFIGKIKQARPYPPNIGVPAG